MNQALQIQVTSYSTTHMGVAIDEKVDFTFTHAIAAVRRLSFSLSRARLSNHWRLMGRSYLKMEKYACQHALVK